MCRLRHFPAAALLALLIWGVLTSGVAQAAAPVSTTRAPVPRRTPPSTTTKPGKTIDLGTILDKVDGLAKPKIPQVDRPHTLLIGDFVLSVEEYSDPGKADIATQQITGASGTAWLSFDCAEDDLLTKRKKGSVLVHFDNVTIVPVQGKSDVGRIIEGTAAYPTKPATPRVIKLKLGGFTALIDVLTLTPKSATANIKLQLPDNIGSADECGPAFLSLGTTSITPHCEFYVEKPSAAYGAWLIGNTSLVVTGSGFTADFSSSQSPASRPSTWEGVVLNSGKASGVGTVPKQSNTGFLAAEYEYTQAVVTDSGFGATALANGTIEFRTINPLDYKVTAKSGSIVLTDSKITSGALVAGTIKLPTIAACKDIDGKYQIEAGFPQLSYQEDLDLMGNVNLGGGTKVCWGELTHPGDTTVSWEVTAKAGYMFLPAGPKATFSPDNGSSFLAADSVTPANVLAYIKARGVSGILINGQNMSDIAIYSRDRPNGTGNPIKMAAVEGWLRIGHRGVDGELNTADYQASAGVPIGNNQLKGYAGNTSFDTSLNHAATKEWGRMSMFQFCTSAVYDSRIDGSINLPEPCSIQSLVFKKMKASSTADLIGGDITLPANGVELDYWKLGLVPTGNMTQAGVVSARTGRLVMTAAGLSEPIHFFKPFRLTWGELLANGSLGELFFDYNPYGQKFDKLKYSPHNIALSTYVKGRTDGYLATCGSVYINYFGSAFANIHDARRDPIDPETLDTPPFFGRKVTCPKTGEAICKPSDLHLQGQWDDALGLDLVNLDFPDATMGYNEKAQDGFIGTGKAKVSFFKAASLPATVQVRGDAVDICMTSDMTLDLDPGLYAALGGMGQVSGCIRIEGPTIKQLSINGLLEQSSSTGQGILEPKSGYVIDVLIGVTPSNFTFFAYGDMLLSMMGSAVDISGSAFLKHDFVKQSAEGDINAKINCTSVVGGLKGNGQLTWFIDPTMQYVQGRAAVSVCSWSGGAGLEGGLFIGHAVPKAKAWVLQTSNGCYGVSQEQLPSTLTGVYGYGRAGFGFGTWVFSGGVDLYAGVGAFTVIPSGATSAWGDYAGIGLPYVVGAAGAGVHGEILGGLVSASAWGNMVLSGPIPVTYEGRFSLEGCVAWVFCGSVSVTAGIGESGFYLF